MTEVSAFPDGPIEPLNLKTKRYKIATAIISATLITTIACFILIPYFVLKHEDKFYL